MSRIRRYLTYSNVTSTLCLFLVLGGGTALALHRNEVKSRNIAPGAVRLSDTNDKLRLNCPGTLINQEWAIERDTSTAQGANGWTVNGAGAPSPSFLSNDLSYRCVARPKR